MGIGASVGKGGTNDLADVIVVQHLLNAWLGATAQPLVDADGDCGSRTIAAIENYQARVLASARPDGLIDPNGRTWTALAAGQGIPLQLSGAAWWRANQARYPNSAALSDLAQPFRERASAFVKAMKDAGAKVSVAATRRNPTRAQLMHYCWRVAKNDIAPDKVPPIPGCTIRWDHGDPARSRKGAQEMVDLFQIAYRPSLTSNHIEGRAIDMTISWTGALKIKDKGGKSHTLETPRTGDANSDLHAIGASYGVCKLLSDPPHWSDDGR